MCRRTHAGGAEDQPTTCGGHHAAHRFAGAYRDRSPYCHGDSDGNQSPDRNGNPDGDADSDCHRHADTNANSASRLRVDRL